MEIFEVFATFSLLDNLSGPMNRIRQTFRSTGAESNSLSDRMGSLTKRLLPLAMAAGVVLGAFAPAVGVAMEFESALSGLGAISNASAADMELMEQSALDLGASTAFSAAQVVEAQTELAKKGFAANEVVDSMSGLLDLAASAQTSLANAADVTAGALNSFQMEASQSGQVADIIAAASSSSATNVEGLGMALQNAGAIVSGAGGDFALLAAITGKLADSNINASVAGTATKIMFSRLAAPVGDAAKMLAKFGVETRDAQGNMLPFLDIMDQIQGGLKFVGSGDRLGILKQIFGDDAASSAMALLNSGIGSLREYHDVLNNSAGSASAMATKQLDNLKGSLTILGSGWEGLSITIGSVFTPVLKVLVDGVTVLVGWLNVIASHPIGKAVLAMVGGIAAVTLAVTLFSAASWAATAAIGAMNFAMLANPVVLIAAALIGGAILIMAYWEEVKAFFATIWQPFDAAISFITRIWNTLAGAFHMDGVSGAFQALFFLFDIDIAAVGKKMLDGLASLGDEIVSFFSCLWKPIVGFIERIELAWNSIVDVFRMDGFAGVIEAVLGLFDIDLSDFGRKMLSSFVDGITTMVKAPFEAVKSALGYVRNLLPFSDAKEGPLSALTLNGQKVMDTIGAGIVNAAPDLHATAANALSGMPIPEASNVSIPAVQPDILFDDAIPELAQSIQATHSVVADIPTTPNFPAIAAPTQAEVLSTAPIIGQNTRPAGEPLVQSPQNKERSSGGVVIQNLTVSLPDVRDSESFVTALQQLVAEFDGHCPEGA